MAFFIIDSGLLNIPERTNQQVLVLRGSRLFDFDNGWLDFYGMVSVYQQIVHNIFDLYAYMGTQLSDIMYVSPKSICHKNHHHTAGRGDDVFSGRWTLEIRTLYHTVVYP